MIDLQPSTNQLDFGSDLDPGLDPGSIFPFLQHGKIGHFSTLNSITHKIVDERSCNLKKIIQLIVDQLNIH